MAKTMLIAVPSLLLATLILVTPGNAVDTGGSGAIVCPAGQECPGDLHTIATTAAAHATAGNSGDADSGWRTPWGDGFKLGQGFVRETSQLATSAIVFKPQPEPKLITSPKFHYTMLSDSNDYSRVITIGASASFEGWGASVSASYRSVDKLKISTKALTAMASLVYVSDPLVLVNPALSDSNVKLTPSAEELLRTKGPIAFHQEHGSHFISGYTKGGSFIGAYIMEFKDVRTAQNNQAKMSASYSSWGMKTTASAEFERDVEENTEIQRHYGTYDCYGWSDATAPQPVCSASDLAKASSQPNLSDGKILEAVLTRYEDLDSYRSAKAQFFAANPKAADYKPMLEANFGILRNRLNAEYLRYHFMARFLAEETDSVLEEIEQEAIGAMREFLMAFGGPAHDDVSGARKNLEALEAYLLTYDKKMPPTTASSDAFLRYTDGEALYKRLWRADELEARMKAQLELIATRFAKVLGPSNMAPWFLRFVAGDAQWIWGAAGSDIGLDRATNSYTFTRTFTLDRPDRCSLYVVSDDICEAFVDGKYVGTAILPEYYYPEDYNRWNREFPLGPLPPGNITIALRCANGYGRGGAAGVIAALVGLDWRVHGVTDKNWALAVDTIATPDISNLPMAPSFGPWDYNRPTWTAFIDDGGWWMWSSNTRDNGNNAPNDLVSLFYANFECTDTSKSVELTIAVDDACFVFLNGDFVGAAIGGFWDTGRQPAKIPMSPRQGTNQLGLRCTNLGGPAGVLLTLRVGGTWVLRSDSNNWHYETTKTL